MNHIHIVSPGVKPGRADPPETLGEKRLAFFGLIDIDAGPPAWLSAFRTLSKRKPGVRLFIGQGLDDPLYALSLGQRLREWDVSEKVRVEGRVEFPAEWLADKDFIISETGPAAPPFWLLTAMAAGVGPLLWGRPSPESFCLPGRHWETEEELDEIVFNESPGTRGFFRDLVMEIGRAHV